MLLTLAHKIQLKPNNIQETFFLKACGVSRFTYNWALAEWQRQYKADLKPSGFPLSKQFNQIRNEQFPWMAETHRDAYARSFIDIDMAFKRFFKKTAKYPVFKKKGKAKDSFYIANDKFKIKDKKVRIPKLGWVRMTETLRFDGKINSAIVSRSADKWFISFSVQTEMPDTMQKPSIVGVDVGIKKMAFLSDGTSFDAPKPLKNLLARLRRLNKSLSRKTIGSNNWKKAKLKLSRLHYKIANIRKDSLHKLSRYLVDNFGTIGIEDLNIAGMVKNHRLSRAILDIGWFELFRQLEYKSLQTATKIVKVDRFFPSSKTCSACGKIHDMPLHRRIMNCSCGLNIDRDLNAALNIKNFAIGSMV